MASSFTPCIVTVTAGSTSEAESLARALVNERLAACCSIISNVSSVYWWEDAVQHDEETLLLCKTWRELFPRMESRVRELHSYDVPEIVAMPVVEGSAPYLAWMESVLNPEPGDAA